MGSVNAVGAPLGASPRAGPKKARGRMWLAVVWFSVAAMTVSYRYPDTAGTFHSSIKALMTSYETMDSNTADIRTENTFYGVLTHALGFLETYSKKADAAGYPEDMLPVTEYDRVLFARMEVDFKSNCLKEYENFRLSCYKSGIDPGTGLQLSASELEQLSGGERGVRKIELLNPGMTRADLRARIQQLVDRDLLFISTYGFTASLMIGVVNNVADGFRTVYFFTVTRKSNDAIGSQVDVIHSLQDFDAVRSYADLQLQHLVWGVFTALLVGLRVLPHFKTQPGLLVYSLTLKLSWHRLKDLLRAYFGRAVRHGGWFNGEMYVFFGYVYFVMTVLITPLFELTGANTLFRDTGTGILNVALMTFQYMGFTDFFSYNAPTFGTYWYAMIFMFFFWVVVLVLVVISQNVLLALVAGAYHRWVLRESPYELAEGLMTSLSRPDMAFHVHVFARWALADLPEMRLLAQLYTEPASDILFMYSPWSWHRSSPLDVSQQAPWDEQLDYPLYCWEDVPLDESGEGPRLRRLPPLFTRDPSEGRPVSRGRLPITYSEGDDLFAMTEEEVDDLLDAAEWCWGRMKQQPLVARCAGLGWSDRGRKLVREGLLEVYRRHMVQENTSTTVGEVGSGSGLVGGGGEPTITAVKASAVHQDTRVHTHTGLMTSSSATTGEATRNRQFSLFNRRGRIAENLDLLWGEVSELRGEVKTLLELLKDICTHPHSGTEPQET
ncbi:hypothetical protein VOLCADRAFT_93353 [Volvox carteri f. nagariensis]|uniref:Uncharacterized protein n=1 Tax=Volvox carteri f. nagariensis TaxID=3068 RepID=D8U1X3_VOLCA|nr:uncharacterized protein VOLCADRAFT_93353 [Volvox carteri f. nagariensis]EFJ46256.1 hypothetical protein VOLCADRAFT_93353 [Volvox carteri f. nagariensis]|eukprot:XP_002952703.1 hypothetical protein VOLCADRAFT_93353 [Volvox carteri f. nagariensis]